MMTSRVVGHTHLWYYVWYHLLEIVWRIATLMNIYKHCARALPYISLRLVVC